MVKTPQEVLYEKEYTIAVPVIEYVVIGHTAIHKKLFLAWTLTMFVAMQILFGAVLGAEAIGLFYWTLLLAAWNFHLANLILIPIEAVAFTLVIGVLLYKRRQYRKTHTTQKEREDLQQMRREAGTDTVDTR